MDALRKTAFGDFQTPMLLARDVCRIIAESGFRPAAVVEPTCGRGAFLKAAIESFPEAQIVLGVEQNREYAEAAKLLTKANSTRTEVRILQRNFFDTDWAQLIDQLPQPLLVLGNPPWVTNSGLGTIGSNNLPPKSNRSGLRGIEALTGTSNFDISEWMLRQNISWLNRTDGMLAVLCKTSVARKVLVDVWTQQAGIQSAAIRRIDAQHHFQAAVDACLLTIRFADGATSEECHDFPTLTAKQPRSVFGLRNGLLVADVRKFDQVRDLLSSPRHAWRSGIKHDSGRIFELASGPDGLLNGNGELVDVESEVLYPLLKSSDLAADRPPRKWLLVPQRRMSDLPERLQHSAPKAWSYLVRHRAQLAKRASSIYRKRPEFSIFGVGDYSFTPWKVAISGLYKSVRFVQVGPHEGRPVVLDDTGYFHACDSEYQASMLLKMLQSEPAQEFLSSLIFLDAKRPVTAHVLNRLDLNRLASMTGLPYAEHLHIRSGRSSPDQRSRRPRSRILISTSDD